MKLLLSLLLLFITLSCSLINAINVYPNQQQQQQQDTYNCTNHLSSLESFVSSYNILSFNGVYQDGGKIGTQSFYENGFIAVDFTNQRLSILFGLQLPDKYISGKTFIYAKNQTQFIMTENSAGTWECTKIPFTSDFPYTNSYKQIGITNLGKVTVQMLTPITQSTLERQQLFVDSKFCAPINAQFNNYQPYPPGYTNMNYLNYVEGAAPGNFDLPSECQSSSSSSSLLQEDIESIKSSLPKILNNIF